MTVETTQWAEYAIKCKTGHTEHHTIAQRTMRMRALEALDRANKAPCGPHVLVQRLVTQIRSEWGPPTDIDPQTASKAAYMEKVFLNSCPKCWAEPGQRCINLSRQAAGQNVFTSWPHKERQDLVT